MNCFIPKAKLYAATKSGIDLGKVSLIEVDNATGKIENFHVSSLHMIPRLFDQELIIAWEQVIDWDKDVIIVSDTIIPADAKNIALSPPNNPALF